MDGDRALAPTVRNCGGRSRDRARARRQRLPRPALPHADGQVVQPVDADELHVRSLGEAGVSFDARAETLQLAALWLAADDRVRVANGDRREFHALVTEVERLGLPHLDTSDVDLDPLAVANDRLDVARADRQRHLLGLRLARKPGRDDSHAVARQLGCRAVRIPDAHLGVRPFHLAPPRADRRTRRRSGSRRGAGHDPASAVLEAQPVRPAGSRCRALATSTMSCVISSTGRSALTLTRPGMRRSHFRW